MKNLILLFFVLSFVSCRSSKPSRTGCPTWQFGQGHEYRINYGDERFDEMEDLVTEVYWVENGDTTFLRNEYRKPYHLVNQETEKVGTKLERK
jgi:hypothetical protein